MPCRPAGRPSCGVSTLWREALARPLPNFPGRRSLTELAAADGMPATVWLLCGDGDRRTIHGFDPLGGDVYTFAAPEGCSALVGVQ